MARLCCCDRSMPTMLPFPRRFRAEWYCIVIFHRNTRSGSSVLEISLNQLSQWHPPPSIACWPSGHGRQHTKPPGFSSGLQSWLPMLPAQNALPPQVPPEATHPPSTSAFVVRPDGSSEGSSRPLSEQPTAGPRNARMNSRVLTFTIYSFSVEGISQIGPLSTSGSRRDGKTLSPH